MGDLGQIYSICTPELQAQMYNLALHADVITPNLTEFCLLANVDYNDLTSRCDSDNYLELIAREGAHLLDSGISTIVITGIIWKAPDDAAAKYYNLIITKDGFQSVSSEIHGGSYSGTGDLLASVLCASMIRGDSALTGVKRACRFIEQALIETDASQVSRNDGIDFEPCLSLLLQPLC